MGRVRALSISDYIMPSDYLKTKFLIKVVTKFGSEGFHLIIELNRMILNSDHGYFAKNNDETLFKLQTITGISRNQIQAILTYAFGHDYYFSKLALNKDYLMITNKDIINMFLKHAKTRKGMARAKTNIKKISNLLNVKFDELVKQEAKEKIKEQVKLLQYTDLEKENLKKNTYTKYNIRNKATKILLDECIIKKEQAKEVDEIIDEIKKKRGNINTFFKFRIPKIRTDYISGNIIDLKCYLFELFE